MLKKIIAGAVVLAAVFVLTATVLFAQTSSYMFYSNLTVGSTGADVVALQSFLQSKGFLTMPAGVAQGYFGGLTKAALASYQSSKGIAPAVGFFGPMTRAAVNADASTGGMTTGGTTCPAGFTCTPTTPVTPTCPVGYTCSSTGGSTSSTEGTLDVTLSGTPANNANIQTSTDVPVLGVTLKARIADVSVDRADIKVSVLNQTTSGYENPGNLINTIKLWDGSNVVKTWNITSADFIKDINDSTIYYVRLSGLGVVVSKDTTKTIVFSFSTNTGIDATRTVTVSGYQSNSLRAVSGNNITSYYDISGLARTQTFKKPGTATITVSSDSNTPDSTNWKVNSTDGVSGVVVGSVNVKSETGDSIVTDVATYVSSTDNVSTVYLYDGSTLIDSKAGGSASSTVKFTNLNIAVAKDTTKTLTFKVDMPSDTANGTVVYAGASTTVTYQTPNGSSASAGYGTTLSVNPQYFYAAAPQFTLISATATAGTSNQTGSTIAPSATFVFKVKPNGASMLAPVAASTTVKFATSSLATITTAGVSTNLTYTPNDSTLADGGEYTVTVSSVISPFSNTAISAGNSIVTFYLTSIQWVVGGFGMTQTYGLDDYKTNPITVTK